MINRSYISFYSDSQATNLILAITPRDTTYGETALLDYSVKEDEQFKYKGKYNKLKGISLQRYIGSFFEYEIPIDYK